MCERGNGCGSCRSGFWKQTDLKIDASENDLRGARVVWEVTGQEPVILRAETAFLLVPRAAGGHVIEAELQFPNGSRGYAVTNFTASAAKLVTNRN